MIYSTTICVENYTSIVMNVSCSNSFLAIFSPLFPQLYNYRHVVLLPLENAQDNKHAMAIHPTVQVEALMHLMDLIAAVGMAQEDVAATLTNANAINNLSSSPPFSSPPRE